MQLRVIVHVGPTKTAKYHSDSSKHAARTAFSSMRDSHYLDLHMMNGAHSALGKQLVGRKKKIHPSIFCHCFFSAQGCRAFSELPWVRGDTVDKSPVYRRAISTALLEDSDWLFRQAGRIMTSVWLDLVAVSRAAATRSTGLLWGFLI